MSSEWKTYRLQEVGRLVTGKTPKSGVPAFDGDDVPFVSPPDFSGNKWITKTVRSISEAGAESVKGSLIPPRSVLVTCIGSDMGKAAITASRCVTNQQINAILVDESRFCPEFVYYNLSLRKDEIRSLAGGSAQPILNKSAFGQIFLEAPCLEVQRKVSEALRPLDDRISLLRETNSTLEAIAQALFKSWFIDFDPVRAKMEGRAPEGMDEVTAALFPDSFEETELGVVPRGWSFSTVGESFILTMGQSPPGDTYNEAGSGLAFYQGRTDFGFRLPTQRVYCSAPTRLAEAGDTLVSVRAPVGDVNMALERCCIGRGVASVRHAKGYHGFTFYAMRSLGERFKTFDSEGTVFGSINKKDFQSLPIIRADANVCKAFDDLTSPLDQKIVKNEILLRTLSTLRDTLLPRLITGQLRIAELSELGEAA